MRNAYAGAGAVVALPHSGNWDLAGAWACLTGMPVTTVAEQLADAEYAAFVAFREGLGMEVLSHRDPGALAALVDAIHRRRVVCLLADRDLSRNRSSGVLARAAHHHARRSGDGRPAHRSGADSRRLPVHRGRHGDHLRRTDPARPGRTGWQR